jgi:imidazolonepropionase
MSYQDIAKAGGGIKSTMKATRLLSVSDLFAQAQERMRAALSFGVTTLEMKTGYGLSLESELKLLDVIARLKKAGPQSVLTTLMAAHALPPEFESYGSYVDWIIESLLPRVAGRAQFQDVFCEKGYFSERDSVRLLEAGKKFGLRPKVHAHEFGRTGGVKAAIRSRAVSADHLMYLSRQDISDLKRASIVPVLLPGTTFFLREKQYAPARALIDAGLPVALGSDFNPGTCPTLNFPLIGSFAAVHMNMTLDEVLWSQTLGSAMALGLNDRGRLEKGMRADFVELDSAGFESLYYHFGSASISQVVIGGRIV